jgi:hypothetical protein
VYCHSINPNRLRATFIMPITMMRLLQSKEINIIPKAPVSTNMACIMRRQACVLILLLKSRLLDGGLPYAHA